MCAVVMMLEPKQLTGLCVLGACPFSNWVSRVCRMFVFCVELYALSCVAPEPFILGSGHLSRALREVASTIGNHGTNVWSDPLSCVAPDPFFRAAVCFLM